MPVVLDPVLQQGIIGAGPGGRWFMAMVQELLTGMARLPEPEFSERDGFVTTIRRLAAEGQGRASVAGTPHVTPPVAPHDTPYVTPHVAPHVAVLVRLIGSAGELASPELLRHLGLRDRKHLRGRYLAPCLKEGWIEMTIADKPKSRDQRYRLTARGRELLAKLSENGGVEA